MRRFHLALGFRTDCCYISVVYRLNKCDWHLLPTWLSGLDFVDTSALRQPSNAQYDCIDDSLKGAHDSDYLDTGSIVAYI